MSKLQGNTMFQVSVKSPDGLCEMKSNERKPDGVRTTTFRYIFRYMIDPHFNPTERINELLRFCEESRAEEVMLFLTAEELFTGHPTIDELRPYVEMGKTLKRGLDKLGVALSLNPWTTLVHLSRGRQFKPGQDFTTIVHENGIESPISACPLCSNWQEYICEAFGFLVRELEPVSLWIEDDWRLHNHEVEGGWGGCFCQLHMDRFSKTVGRTVTREQLLEKILAPGEPHPWRQMWLELSRDSLIEPAIKIRDVLYEIQPSIQIGLMSSNPDVHSIEGRDWPALQHAFGAEPAFLTRPNLPPYIEAPAISTPPTVTRQTIANLEGSLEIYPELENGPRGGPYSKSVNYCTWQCLNAALYGSNGITINHFDMLGNGTAIDPTFAVGMAKAKPRLNALVELGIDDNRSQGVKVLFSPNVAAYRHSGSRVSLGGLYNASCVWSQALYIMGIAHGVTKQIVSDGSPYAVSDQTLRAFDDQAIRRLLSGPVMLDGISVEILLERGFGKLIGIKSSKWETLSSAAYSYESIVACDSYVTGLAYPRMTAQYFTNRLLALQPQPDAEVRSSICGPNHCALFPGSVMFENDLGGRVLSIAYPFDLGAEQFMGFFNVFRRVMLQRLLFEMAPQARHAMVENHPMYVYRTTSQAGELFAAFNVISDEAPQVVFRIPHGQIRLENLEVLSSQGQWERGPVELHEEGLTDRLVIARAVAPLDGVFAIQR